MGNVGNYIYSGQSRSRSQISYASIPLDRLTIYDSDYRDYNYCDYQYDYNHEYGPIQDSSRSSRRP
jgi:hypothetical protein